MNRRTIILILGCLSLCPAVAQPSLNTNAKAISSSSMGTESFHYANQNEPPRAIEFNEKTVSPSHFIDNINNYFNIPDAFDFIETGSNTDALGMHHRFLQQYYKSIPLEGLGYRVHERGGFVTAANGKAVRDINVDTLTTLSEEQAFHFAVSYVQTKDTTFRKANKLIVSKDFTFTPESFFIAFQFDIDVSLLERWRVSIDARSGKLLNKVSLVNSCLTETPPLPYGTGTGLTNYYGSQTIRVEKFDNDYSKMVGQTENGVTIGTYDFRNASILGLIFGLYEVYDFTSSNNTYNNPYHKPAVSVQWAADLAYEYYLKKHNRNSFDNNGGAIKSYVHVDRDLNNAFWNGEIMAFGDGSNNNPLVELDVVSHELTHGVTQYEAQLYYYSESGALNESFSDILGKAVEFDTFGDTATWQLGRRSFNGGLRDFSNPNLKNQPDTYFGDMWFTGYEDNGGVHYNSGVQNFWFYLLCEGGVGVNDHQADYAVKAIGMDTAVNITYRNLTEYLGSTSDYLDSRIGSLLATADLYGKNSNAYQQVASAWDAVGVIDEPIITSLHLYDITATTVKIKGSLLPRGDTVTYYFEYGTTPAFGSSTSAYKYTDKVEGILTGLQSETRYYLRLVATNENGSTYASTEFTTISLAPLVKIKETVDITDTTAILYGQINPNSLPTSFYFEYGVTNELGSVTLSYEIADTTEFLDISAVIANLQPRKTYYYKLVATNEFSSSATELLTFYTAVKPVISSYHPVSAPTGTEVTITGNNFNSVTENNVVNFGATRATVLSSSPTEVKVVVPAGASLGPISLLDAESGLTTESIEEFVPALASELKEVELQLTAGVNDIYIWHALVQDMDGDNRPDIFTSHYKGFTIFQNVNQGGDITNESFLRNSYSTELTSELYLADLDGNGLKDVIGQYGNRLRIYPNFSVPGYIFFGTSVDLATEDVGRFLFSDFDQDGHIDIAGTRYLQGDSSVFTIFRNQNPKGDLSSDNFPKRYEKPLPYQVFQFHMDDLNNDGLPDVMCSTYGKNYVSILNNNSYPGAFDFDESITGGSTAGRFGKYLSQDLNQDGWKDIASHSVYDVADMAVMENEKSSVNVVFADPIIVSEEHVIQIIQPGDLDGDGKVDLIAGIKTGEFIFFKNKTTTGGGLSTSSFESLKTFHSTVRKDSELSEIVINDLNSDGKPDIIITNSISSYPNDTYKMEIWQNSPSGNCPDPSLITVKTSNNSASIELPANTTLDQFEIEYTLSFSSYWSPVYSTTLNLTSGSSYKLRARAKCYLGFTDYYYINFTTHCVDITSFSISNIGVSSVTLNAADLSSFEVYYSLAGKDQWNVVSQYADKISDLSPGTTYDLRFRGRYCYDDAEYNYMTFTTLCPELSSITVADLVYNRAVVHSASNYNGNALLEYSADNINWTMIDETGIIFPLVPATKYYVRAAFACTDIHSNFIYTTFTTPCPKVSMLHADSVEPFKATITWMDEFNSDSYTVTYSKTSGGPETTAETNLSSFYLDDLQPGTEYRVAVAPQCTLGKEFSTIYFSTVCYVPSNLSVDAITPATAELSWDDNNHGFVYSVDYSISGSNIWQTETTLADISLNELRPGTEYEVRVHVNCFDETRPASSVQFQTDLYEQTTFAPNPTDREIVVYPSRQLIGSHVSIADNTGRIVIDSELVDYTIDLSVLSPGIYILKIDGEYPVKLIKR